eukprot:1180760-Prorocentrum_minimum.AAC.3
MRLTTLRSTFSSLLYTYHMCYMRATPADVKSPGIVRRPTPRPALAHGLACTPARSRGSGGGLQGARTSARSRSAPGADSITTSVNSSSSRMRTAICFSLVWSA